MQATCFGSAILCQLVLAGADVSSVNFIGARLQDVAMPALV
jgi:uncharacterized protein YjbI with pentapeptide repeats